MKLEATSQKIKLTKCLTIFKLNNNNNNVYFKSLSYTNVLFKLEMKAQTK
jgi:hypothetical protein